jgi:DNA-binding beta-propeller fold protein YncE
MDPPMITRPPVPTGRAARSRPRRATGAKPGGRWPGWVPPLAAAAAAAVVIAGTVGASSALDRPGVTPPAGPARQAIAYVVNDTAPGTVTPIRTATNTALAPVKVRPHPDAIAITPDGTTAYAVSTGESNNSGTVTPIRTATNMPLAPVKVGGDPVAIAITPDGRTAYVASLASATVTPIRTATNTPLTPIKVGHSAHYTIAITPDGQTAYVADPPVNVGRGTVTAIRTATNTALTPIKAVDHPMAIAITPRPGPGG